MGAPSLPPLAALALPFLLVACAFADLRPPELRASDPDPERALRGRALLAGAVEATGGAKAWARVEAAEMVLDDRWRGVVGWLFRPWPHNPTRLRMRFEFGMGGGWGEFLTGPRRGERWGRDGEHTWTRAPGAERVDLDRERVRFILGAYQFFFELPARVAQAPIVSFAGSRERGGRRYDLVFATWGRAEPHAEHDQYLLWIAADTGRIEIAQYTIRDKFRFATGVNAFSDFRAVDGLVLPHRWRIARHLDDRGFVHRVKLEDVRLFPSPPPTPARAGARRGAHRLDPYHPTVEAGGAFSPPKRRTTRRRSSIPSRPQASRPSSSQVSPVRFFSPPRGSPQERTRRCGRGEATTTLTQGGLVGAGGRNGEPRGPNLEPSARVALRAGATA